MRQFEILETELLMPRPMRYAARTDVYETADGLRHGAMQGERKARADALTDPDLAPLRLGIERLIAIAIGRIGRRAGR